jgi:hypothetical protein
MLSRRLLLIAGASLSLLLGGCSLGAKSSTGSSAGFTGTKALVASTLNLLASDASSTSNGPDICSHVLSTQLQSRLNKIGKCSTIIDNQLKTIDDTTLTVKSITLNGSNATARVQTVNLGKKVISTVTLHEETAGWRISGLGA